MDLCCGGGGGRGKGRVSLGAGARVKWSRDALNRGCTHRMPEAGQCRQAGRAPSGRSMACGLTRWKGAGMAGLGSLRAGAGSVGGDTRCGARTMPRAGGEDFRLEKVHTQKKNRCARGVESGARSWREERARRGGQVLRAGKRAATPPAGVPFLAPKPGSARARKARAELQIKGAQARGRFGTTSAKH